MKILRVRESGYVTTAERNIVYNFKKQITCGAQCGESGHIQENHECEGQSHCFCFSNLSKVVTALAEENVGREHVIA